MERDMIEGKPGFLYQYQPLTMKTFQCLIEDHMWFSDPSGLNDPAELTLQIEESKDEDLLQKVALNLLIKSEERAQGLHYALGLSERVIAHRRRLIRSEVEEQLNGTRYFAEDEGADLASVFQRICVEAIRGRFSTGVRSFSSSRSNAKMWSHYAGSHGGFVVGYAFPENAKYDVQKVSYGPHTPLQIADLVSLSKGDAEAEQNFFRQVMFAKSSIWADEDEWRLLGPVGLHPSPLKRRTIIFGMRCNPTMKMAIVRLLKDHAEPLEFMEARLGKEKGAVDILKLADDQVDGTALAERMAWPKERRDNPIELDFEHDAE